jgi:paraquat-inducible protein B
LVWIVPIVAAIAGAWVAVTRILAEGPKITIVFKSAEGLEAGKTKIHYNGVDIGTINTIQLSPEPHSGRTIARETVQGDGFEALAAGHSRALATLSADIAAAIREGDSFGH